MVRTPCSPDSERAVTTPQAPEKDIQRADRGVHLTYPSTPLNLLGSIVLRYTRDTT